MPSRHDTAIHDPTDHGVDPVPPANEPGHHPEVEQDKPLGRRPRPQSVEQGHDGAAGSTGGSSSAQRFAFRFAGPVGKAARLAVMHEDRAYVEVDDQRLLARFGLWMVETRLTNVAGATLTGPYQWWKVIGPPHLSFADRGLTLATNAERGVCIEFREPVPGIEPTGRIRHPGLTVTVDDVDGLMSALER
jgi:hypothetical protein